MTDVEDIVAASTSIRQNPFDIELYLLRGQTWFELKCFDEAASDLMFYESWGGSNPEFRKYLGKSLSKTSSKRALEYLSMYLKSNPDDLDTLAYCAETYFQNGDYSESARLYKLAVSKGYEPSIVRMKAQLLKDQKLYDDAALFDPSFGKKSLFRR